MLDGLEDLPLLSDCEPYIPGEDSESCYLAQKVVSFYMEKGKKLHDKSILHQFEEEIYQHLLTLENLGGQDFLDMVMQSLIFGATPYEMKRSGLLFTPVLNALYTAGFDSFRVDFTAFPDVPEQFAREVKGRSGKPLTIECIVGDSATYFWIGHYAEHLSIHHSGDARGVGSHARHCEFTLEDPVHFMGYASQGCTFLLPNVSDVKPVLLEFVNEYGDDVIRYRLETVWADKEFNTFVEGDFFISGNKILVPDASGEWAEVAPE